MMTFFKSNLCFVPDDLQQLAYWKLLLLRLHACFSTQEEEGECKLVCLLITHLFCISLFPFSKSVSIMTLRLILVSLFLVYWYCYTLFIFNFLGFFLRWVFVFGHPETSSIDQVGLELTESTCLLLPKCWD